MNDYPTITVTAKKISHFSIQELGQNLTSQQHSTHLF